VPNTASVSSDFFIIFSPSYNASIKFFLAEKGQSPTNFPGFFKSGTQENFPVFLHRIRSGFH
jgi:hypothetical protein